MSETPREYKKRIDEKWKRNENNKEKLIKKIEWYELLDEGFKTRNKQEILANFEKNQKAELESEQYTMIVTELWKIDKKYEEFDTLEEQLKAKKKEKNEIEKEIKWLKLDWADETTLNLQWASVRKLDEKLENLKSEIEDLEKKIKDRKLEIKEIEDSYWKKIEENITEENLENEYEAENFDQQDLSQPETLKEVHEQVIKELWSKDKTRKNILRLLDSWTWIDDELKEKIQEEINKKFFKYYDKRQWNLKVKSARYMKNKVKKWDNDILQLYDWNGLINHIRETELFPFRRRWKEKITYNNDKNNEYQKKMTDALDKIFVKIKIDNWNRIIEFKLWHKSYKLLVVEDLNKHSDSEYLSWWKLHEKWMIWHNPDNWKNKKLAEYIKEQEKKWFIIPTWDCMRDMAKKLTKLIGNDTDNQNTHIGHLMYLIWLEWDYRIDDFEKCSNWALARAWIWFRFDYNSRHCLYSGNNYERAKLLMIHKK